MIAYTIILPFICIILHIYLAQQGLHTDKLTSLSSDRRAALPHVGLMQVFLQLAGMQRGLGREGAGGAKQPRSE